MTEVVKEKLKEKAASLGVTTDNPFSSLDSIANLISAETAIQTAGSIKSTLEKSLASYSYH